MEMIKCRYNAVTGLGIRLKSFTDEGMIRMQSMSIMFTMTASTDDWMSG